MALSVPSRETARDRLKTLIEAQIAGFEEVFNHVPRTFEGKSPVCTVSSVGFAPDRNPYRYTWRFAIGIWVRRDLSTGVGASEDTLDTLMQDVAQFELDNKADATLHILRIPVGEFSETAYPVVDGTPYRVEFVTFECRPQVIAS